MPWTQESELMNVLLRKKRKITLMRTDYDDDDYDDDEGYSPPSRSKLENSAVDDKTEKSTHKLKRRSSNGEEKELRKKQRLDKILSNNVHATSPSTCSFSSFMNHLHVTDSEVRTTPWASILEKVVQVQRSQQLCVLKDLSTHDVVMRIMRKENYLIGMLNKGVLSFSISKWVPGTGPAVNFGSNGKKSFIAKQDS
ncbi:hypothetical protein IFM89_037291 [Coptis chinensis]|uniref:Autophagy-related protein 9 n=1 Tax=Coptis chinensis TaxID=261450 RepID=A0A835LXL1_9MAGN|nr:hypothetical protein IFM89_037291 [Coptis chinensis]